jgi:hypothetical protein
MHIKQFLLIKVVPIKNFISKMKLFFKIKVEKSRTKCKQIKMNL